MDIKLMSFNVQHCLNYVTREIDYDCMAEAIRACGADVIGLNEIFGCNPDPVRLQEIVAQNLHSTMGYHYDAPNWIGQVEQLAARLGYYCYFAKAVSLSGLGDYGNAILSRFPIRKAETVTIPDPETHAVADGYYETRCVLRVELEVPGGLTVCVSHFGLNPDELELAVQTAVSQIEPQRFVLMGDFNFKPDYPGLQPLFARLQDTAKQFDEPKLSFPSDLPDRKIDYILTSEDVTVIAADIPNLVASDHRPHTALIRI